MYFVVIEKKFILVYWEDLIAQKRAWLVKPRQNYSVVLLYVSLKPRLIVYTGIHDNLCYNLNVHF